MSTESPPPSPAVSDDPLPFTPVPIAPRRDGWTPERQRAFIGALRECGLVSAAAEAVGMTARTAYRLRERPGAEGFAAAWDDAVADGLLHAKLEAFDRAIHGEEVPIFYRGLQVGVRRRYNDRLLIAAMQVIRNDPDRLDRPGSRRAKAAGRRNGSSLSR